MNKKEIISTIFISIIFILISMSCATDFPDESVQLENGVTLNQEEVETLKSMETKAYAIQERIITESTRNNAIDASDQIVKEWINLLKEEFGDNYKKYIIEGTHGSQTVDVPVEDESRAYVVIDDKPGVLHYAKLTFDCKWVCLPWGAYNYATTKVQGMTKGSTTVLNLPASYIGVTVSDAAGTVSKTLYKTHYVLVNGKLKKGFFPKSYNPKTIHKAGGHYPLHSTHYRTYYWRH